MNASTFVPSHSIFLSSSTVGIIFPTHPIFRKYYVINWQKLKTKMLWKTLCKNWNYSIFHFLVSLSGYTDLMFSLFNISWVSITGLCTSWLICKGCFRCTVTFYWKTHFSTSAKSKHPFLIFRLFPQLLAYPLLCANLMSRWKHIYCDHESWYKNVQKVQKVPHFMPLRAPFLLLLLSLNFSIWNIHIVSQY